MKKNNLTFIVLNLSITFCFLSGVKSKAQNIGINGTGANAHASALLDIDDAGTNTKGILIPRISLTAINVATPVTSPATSLLVYNTVSASTGTNAVSPGYYYWDGVKWVRFAYNASGNSANDWNTLGNLGTNSSTHFLGTVDNQDLVFRANNSEIMRVLANGRVGIGLINPSQNLEVINHIGIRSFNPFLYFNSTFTTIPGDASIGIRSAGEVVLRSNITNTLMPDWEVKYGTGTYLNPNDFFYVGRRATSTATLTHYLAINSAGNVGINTVNPISKLHVLEGQIAQTYTTNTSHSIYMGNPSGRNWQLYHLSPLDANAPNGFMFEHFDGSVWQRRMTINQAGNVGIGSNNPNARLYLKDNLPNASVDLVIENSAPSGQAWVLESVSTYTNITNGSFLIGNRTTSQNHFAINPSGNVGIGTSINLDARTTISGGQALPGGWSKVLTLEANHPAIQFKSTNTYIQPGSLGGSAWIEYDDAWPTAGIGGLSFRVADTLNQFNTSNRAMIINKKGNVGINTTIPSTKLHVVSTTSNTAFRMQDGTEGTGKVLTSDASGNATWQSPSALANYPYQSIGALPMGANCPVGGTYATSTVVLPAGIYYYTNYSCDGQIGASTPGGFNVDIQIISGTGDSNGTFHDFNIGFGGSCGNYFTGIVRCFTPCTVRRLYTSYSGSSFTVSVPNSESTLFIKIL